MYQDELLNSDEAAKLAFDETQIDAAGSNIRLYDEDGELLEEAFVNEEGKFAFSQLEQEKMYRLEVGDEIRAQNPELFIMESDGGQSALASDVIAGGLFAGALLMAKRDQEDEGQLADSETGEVDMSQLTATVTERHSHLPAIPSHLPEQLSISKTTRATSSIQRR